MNIYIDSQFNFIINSIFFISNFFNIFQFLNNIKLEKLKIALKY